IMGSVATLFVGTMTGILCWFALIGISLLLPSRWFEAFLSGYVAPSTALTAMALLVVGPNQGWWPFLKIPLGLLLLYLTSIYRLGWAEDLRGLRPQIEVARVLGASRWRTLWGVILPQLSVRAGGLAAVAAVWAGGDFAVSRIVAHKDLTLAMITETLMSGYRLGLASVLSVPLMICAGLCGLIVWGWGYVFGKRSAL
ncbi:MAG: ABC transporter permease subunit, partial [Bdellovibrionaceae bacterium]|nr:ABC transporter permease subunit [Pseudobdellovibrionaceae bacterium]